MGQNIRNSGIWDNAGMKARREHIKSVGCLCTREDQIRGPGDQDLHTVPGSLIRSPEKGYTELSICWVRNGILRTTIAHALSTTLLDLALNLSPENRKSQGREGRMITKSSRILAIRGRKVRRCQWAYVFPQLLPEGCWLGPGWGEERGCPRAPKQHIVAEMAAVGKVDCGEEGVYICGCPIYRAKVPWI